MAKDPMFKARVRTGLEKGFRRAGFAFSREGKEIEVTASTLEILKAEKNLVVEELGEVKAEDSKAAAAADKDKPKK